MNASRPKPSESWHPVARYWYNSLAKSGQSHFYECSDWAAAYFLAECMSRDLAAGQIKAASINAFIRGCQALLVTEGDRRRLRLELQRPSSASPALDDPAVAKMDAYRAKLAAHQPSG